MVSNRCALALTCLAILPAARAAEPRCGGHGDRGTLLVSTAWLAQHLHDPNLVVLAVGPRADYDQSHIPSALFLDYNDIHTMPGEGHTLTLELPPMEQLKEVFEKLGANHDSRIVLYTTKGINQAETRVFLTADAMGLGARTSILDGGFSVWRSEDRAVSTDVRPVTRGKLELCPQSDIIVDAGYVSSHLRHSGVDIVDARDPQYYSGQATSPGKRAGHIPGAANLTYSTLVDGDGKLNSVERLRQQFAGAGVKEGDRVVSYCHIGQQDTLVYFAARYLGFDARLYDGSWEDWSAHTELPAEVATEPRK
jgi:thiosulfate/3-mercaptopyruvate sulfurtransferase